MLEELPEEVKLEVIGNEGKHTNNMNNSSIPLKRKQKTLANVLEMHIKKREERREAMMC